MKSRLQNIRDMKIDQIKLEENKVKKESAEKITSLFENIRMQKHKKCIETNI